MNATDDIKTYRGRTLEEVLPKIKAELGPEAVIVRQREGLTGGVGGFFQRPCIEVDARAAEPEVQQRFDAYDEDEPVTPQQSDALTEEGLTAPGIQEILRQAAPFADHLNAASRRGEPAGASEPEEPGGPDEHDEP